MPEDTIRVEAYSKERASSIAEHLFIGVPSDVVHSQRESLLAPGPDEVYSVCALENQDVIGVCTGVRMKWHGSRHRIELVQIVVHEAHQRRGVARMMIRTTAEHFRIRGVEIVQVSSEKENQGAIKAYQRVGFSEFGLLPNGLKYDDRYVDEVMLSARIEELLESTD